MNDLIKSPYKISLWEDEQVYLVADKNEEGNYDVNNRYEIKTIPTVNQIILNKYTREICLANIGSNTMNTPIRAFEPRFIRQVNGTNTLTFKMFYRYFDEDAEDFKINPFTSLLVNERKIKLFYEDKWYNLIIKQIQENSRDYTFTYTCQDLYLNELSKNGYELVFDTELLNNMGTVTELGTTILEGTDWQIDSNNSDKILQTKGEALFTYQTEEEIIGKVLIDYKYKLETLTAGTTLTIPKNAIIFIGYSFYTEGKVGDSIQFFYRTNGDYITDDDGNIINSPIYTWTPPAAFWNNTSLKITSSYYGKTLISSSRVYYIPEIEKFCYKYKRIENGIEKEYYAYMGSEFASFSEAENLIYNSSDFITTDGWTDAILSTTTTEGEIVPTIQVNFDNLPKNEITNSGLQVSKAILQNYEGFTKGDKYLFAIKTNDNSNILQARATLTTTNSQQNNSDPIQIFNSNQKVDIKDIRLEKYLVFELTVENSFSYTEVAQSYLDFYIKGQNTVEIIDAKLFKKVYRKYKTTEGIEEKLFIPDLEDEVETSIQDKYFFFEANELDGEKIILSADDIKYSTICLKDEISENGYVLIDSENFEKVTNITASKSNRFNLIQKLCETFECWAKFIIEWNSDGSVKEEYILTEDTKQVLGKKYYTHIGNSEENRDYQFINFEQALEDKIPIYEKRKRKFIQFKEYIGIENFTGFRYGINLTSINRELNSNQITTKLIVEPNVNEYAPDGFCTIQRAVHNPTGEAVIYNFKYYLNNGLIDKDELNLDLYDSENSIGFFTQLQEINKENAPYIKELTEVSNNLTKALARYQIYTSIIEEAGAKKAEYISDLGKALKDSGIDKEASTITIEKDDDGNYIYNDVIVSLIRQRDAMEATINKYTPQQSNMKSIVENYKIWKEGLESTLAKNEEKTKQLNKEFFNKYSRYMQEGTWISESFIDDDLYYFAAQSVSNTSAVPQVQYTINVIDVSADEEYRNYKFNIGDKTYIEDVEFFGYVPNTRRPYQEEVVITEMIYNLDNPSDNTIKIKNYKTQFEDLFQRVAAAAQTLQYSEGKYARASDAIKEDGTIDGSVLEKTLNFNYCLSNAISKEISEGGEVITLQSVIDPNRIVKISGLGMELSSTGGRDWKTAISADGINADVGVFGSLHTNNLKIYNGDDESFFWDANGITAYNWNDGNGTIYNQFVRMSKDGIYGYIGEEAKKSSPVSISDIQKNSVFSLTWKGLALQSLNNNNYVKLSTIGESTGYYNVKLTTDKYNPTTIYYSFSKGEYVEAKKTEENFIFDENKNIIGFNPTATLYKKDSSPKGLKKIIWAGAENGDNFIVYEDGSIFAKNGYFEGDIYANNGYFKGEIEATGGSFTGSLKAPIIEGNLIGTNNSAILGPELGIGGTAVSTKTASNGKFYVDSAGNVTMNGSITLNGDITWSSTNNPITGIEIPESYTDADVKNYLANTCNIVGTTLSKVKIESPTIEGNNVITRKAFKVTPKGKSTATGEIVDVNLGFMGAAFGLGFKNDGTNATTDTYGVALAHATTSTSDGFITPESEGQYVIVTDKGVRLQAGVHNLTITTNGLYYDGKPFASSGAGGSVIAVWG